MRRSRLFMKIRDDGFTPPYQQPAHAAKMPNFEEYEVLPRLDTLLLYSSALFWGAHIQRTLISMRYMKRSDYKIKMMILPNTCHAAWRFGLYWHAAADGDATFGSQLPVPKCRHIRTFAKHASPCRRVRLLIHYWYTADSLWISTSWIFWALVPLITLLIHTVYKTKYRYLLCRRFIIIKKEEIDFR